MRQTEKVGLEINSAGGAAADALEDQRTVRRYYYDSAPERWIKKLCEGKLLGAASQTQPEDNWGGGEKEN